MKKSLFIRNNEKEIYLNQVIYKCELIRNHILNAFSKEFIFVSCLDFDDLEVNQIYFSLDSYKGIGRFEDEFNARKKLLDILKFFKKCFFDFFKIETIEAKVALDIEKYELLFVDNFKHSTALLSLTLENHILNFELDNLSSNICKILLNSYDGYYNWERSNQSIAVLAI